MANLTPEQIREIRAKRVDQYHAAAQQRYPGATPLTDEMSKAEKRSALRTHPATREQIEYAVALAYEGFPGSGLTPERQEQLKIETLRALSRGVNLSHCSVQIDKLKGSFEGFDRPLPAPQAEEAEEPEAIAATGGSEGLSADMMPW